MIRSSWQNMELDEKAIIFKFFKRFLKENGIYKRSMWLFTHDMIYGRKKSIYDLLNKDIDPVCWIKDARLFCVWAKTPERDKFWWEKHICWEYEYYCYCEKNNKRCFISKQLILSDIINYSNFYTETYNLAKIKYNITYDKK